METWILATRRIIVLLSVVLAVVNILGALRLGISTSVGSNSSSDEWVHWEEETHTPRIETNHQWQDDAARHKMVTPTRNPDPTNVTNNHRNTILVVSPPKLVNKRRRQRRRIFMVHVGKTGGETVRNELQVTCGMRIISAPIIVVIRTFSGRLLS